MGELQVGENPEQSTVVWHSRGKVAPPVLLEEVSPEEGSEWPEGGRISVPGPRCGALTRAGRLCFSSSAFLGLASPLSVDFIPKVPRVQGARAVRALMAAGERAEGLQPLEGKVPRWGVHLIPGCQRLGAAFQKRSG